MTVMIDAYSGYILGFYISFYGPGLTSVCGVVRNALLPKAPLLHGLDLQSDWLSMGLGDEWVIDNVLNAIGLLPNGNSIVHRSGGADRETLKNGEQSRRRASAAQGCLG